MIRLIKHKSRRGLPTMRYAPRSHEIRGSMMYWVNRLVLSMAMYVCCICGCSGGDRSIQGEVLQTPPSPDASANAILSKSGNGATVSDVYRVYLQDRVTRGVVEVLRADRAG